VYVIVFIVGIAAMRPTLNHPCTTVTNIAGLLSEETIELRIADVPSGYNID